MRRRIIALAGRAGAGKDTVAELLGEIDEHVVTVSFAEPFKRFCQTVFDFSESQLFGPSQERNRPDPRYPREHGPWDGGRCLCCGALWSTPESPCLLTPRYALQSLGTEWGRACFPDTWASKGVRTAQAALAAGFLPVITDCRFTNEARVVRAAGGEVWLVERPGAGLSGSAALHPSEVEVTTPGFLANVTREIDNSGTLEALASTIRAVLADSI